MDSKIYLYGASGHCKVVVDILKSNNEKIEAILDDNPKAASLLGIPVIPSADCKDLNSKKILITIGNNSIRKKISKTINSRFHIGIHAKAIVSSFSEIGEGTVVMAGAILNAGSSIGKHCIINTGAIIEHDCFVNDYVHVSPNASLAGGVIVGRGSHIGIGACVIQGVKIGKWTSIGAGAVIIRDVPDFAVVVGNPGKVIKIKVNKSNEKF
ncbi:acetyltransferase [Flavobacterium weaverense]|uniref:Acetyltransferase EpsM n=1 Tax=Flavobacterium weaverense TaxID=271156 RepID=A0A3M0A6X2_9FLAO|nr:acetyltransferase [Flavobacterium weaverense]RMA74842.1 acetyltransferase EpsM [Flavobacterium weaverense]